MESKFSISEVVKFTIENILFIGKIVGVTFTKHGIFYDIDDDNILHRGVQEEIIEIV